MQNACFFSTVNIYMLLHIYRFYSSGCTPAHPAHCATSLVSAPFAQPGEGSESAGALRGSMAWGATAEVLERHGAALRGIGKARGREQGRPAHACSLPPAATQGHPRAGGPPQRPATTAEAARGGEGMWSPLQQQQQNQKAKIWRYSGIFFKK